MTEALAPAKINLFLHVGPVQPDGYHPICSLMEKVSLYDRVSLEKSDRRGIRLKARGLPQTIPPGANIIERAVRLLQAAAGMELGVDIVLEKNIPVAAGLAGGSSNAAAALDLVISEYGMDIGKDRLKQVALSVGADVPFFLEGGAQLAEGVGQVLTPVDLHAGYAAVVATPPAELSTARVYGLYDEMCHPGPGLFKERCDAAKRALETLTGLDSLARVLHNDLETPAISLCPSIAALKQTMLQLGAAGALMSGSGPSVFGLFASVEQADKAASVLSETYSRVWAVKPV